MNILIPIIFKIYIGLCLLASGTWPVGIQTKVKMQCWNKEESAFLMAFDGDKRIYFTTMEKEEVSPGICEWDIVLDTPGKIERFESWFFHGPMAYKYLNSLPVNLEIVEGSE